MCPMERPALKSVSKLESAEHTEGFNIKRFSCLGFPFIVYSPNPNHDYTHLVSSVAHSCPTLCDPMNRSTPGLPAHHKLPESTQTHVH